MEPYYFRCKSQSCLPGNDYAEVVFDYAKSQNFNWINGYSIPTECQKSTSVKDCLIGSCIYDPFETYGIPRPNPPPPFIPNFVKNEKKVLKYFAFYRECIPNSQWNELYRVRPVEIFYFLEDDSISVYEPPIENSGLVHGPLIRRQRITKNNLGQAWNWKDLNLGCDIVLFSRTFRIVDANKWTKQYYHEEGMILNEPEEIPLDPYLKNRYPKKDIITEQCNGLVYREEHENGILKFECVWDNGENQSWGQGKKPMGSIPYKCELLYYLADGHVEIIQDVPPNIGREQHKLLLHKVRPPKNWKDLPNDFPISALEPTDREIVEYYTPIDFKIGDTVNIYGRKLLICKMDEWTEQFYRDYFGWCDFQEICLDEPEKPNAKLMIPPWNGFGSPEDSLRNCLAVTPKVPIVVQNQRSLEYGTKTLNFGVFIDSARPEDEGREFIIHYRIMDDKISVYEIPVRNSGWPGGKFLDFISIQKPGSSNDNPIYYRPHDFYIGASIEIFGNRFCIRCADDFVEEFMDENSELFPEEVLMNLKNWFNCKRDNTLVAMNAEANESCLTPEEALTNYHWNECGQFQCDTASNHSEGIFEHLGLGEDPSKSYYEEQYDNFRGCGYD